MEQQFDVNAEVRQDTGKGASRRLRRGNGVPAILYGSHQEPLMLTLKHNEIVKHLEHENFYSHILTLHVAGQASETAVLRDVQRHPFKPIIMHVDFQRVSASEAITMSVPLHFINQEKCVAVKQGGIFSHHEQEVMVRCLPKDLPEFIEVDMINMKLNEVIHLSSLVMPDGVTLVELMHGEAHDLPIASLHLPKSTSNVDDEENNEAAE